MSAQTADWLKGLAAAAIGGGSSAFTGGVAATYLAPEKFGAGHLGATLKLVGAIFLLSAITHVLAYLTTRPTPWSGQERRVPPTS